MSHNVLKTLRELRVLVVHPHDREGEILIRQLKRIGCQVEAVWPLPTSLPPMVDVVFVTVEENALSMIQKVFSDDRPIRPTLIALVAYEAPTVLQVVLEINADTVITRPLRSFGVMTNLVVARQVWLKEKVYREKADKLQRKVKSINKINQAKSMLMSAMDISEDKAYKIIRDGAMSKRLNMEEMAISIINANNLLQSLQKRD